MKTGISILAGLLAGILVAVGILAAFVFVGPDPVGLRPTPPPTLVPATPSPAPSIAASPSVPAASPSGPGTSPAGSPGGSVDPAALHIGQPAPALVVPQLGGGTIDLASLKGKAVWLTFMQTTCRECVDELPLMSGFAARHADDGLVVIAVDIREAESVVTAFVQQLKATIPVGLDTDGKAQQTWGAYALPTHVWIDTDGVVRDGALGGVDTDVMAAALRKILPGVTVTP